MKAILLHEFGPPEQLTPGELPDPVAAAGELLVRVEGSSVNPVDTKIRSGALSAVCNPLPAVLHGDVLGTVEALGENVTDFAVGDRIWACAGGVKGSDGALVELMRVDHRLASLAPASLPGVEAAALPLVGITAWEAVVERAQVRPGQRVLVHGATGGVGHIAVQLAKLAGAFVHATVSVEDKVEAARELGADEVFVGRENQQLQNAYDIVIDTLGGSNLGQSFHQIDRGGKVVTIAARTEADLSPLHAKAASLEVVFMLLPLLTGKGREAHGAVLRHLAALVNSGRVQCRIAERYSFAEAATAHRAVEETNRIGKVLLTGW